MVRKIPFERTIIERKGNRFWRFLNQSLLKNRHRM